jgi:hypothetical protein
MFSQIFILVLFLIILAVMPILVSNEARKLNKEISVGNWIIKPTFSNSKSMRFSSRTFGFLLGIFAVVFILLNMFNVI